jgi:hypothetical protein
MAEASGTGEPAVLEVPQVILATTRLDDKSVRVYSCVTVRQMLRSSMRRYDLHETLEAAPRRPLVGVGHRERSKAIPLGYAAERSRLI